MVDARPTSYQLEPDFAARQSILWSIAWLVGGVTIALFAALLTIKPGLSLGLPFLSYGRVRAVADTAVVFGWLGTVAFAALFALLPRIADVQLHNEVLGATSTLFWSIFLTVGIGSLLLGVNQGRPFGELGALADLFLALMLVVVLFNAVVTVVRRRERTLYVSGWFLLAGALLAPVIFIIGNLPVFNGVVDAIVGAFYVNGLQMLWFLPIGLGIAHYVVPVESGSALNSVALARASFWSLMFAGGWTGGRLLLKGPAPDYIETIAVAMTFVLLLPVLSAAANLFATARDRWTLAANLPGLRYAATAIALSVVWIALEAVSSIPSFSRFVGLTAWGEGVRFFSIFGVFSFFGFALVYHAYPLMIGRDWFSRTCVSLHYWGTIAGVLITTTALMAAGAAQGAELGLGQGQQMLGHPNVIDALRVIAVAGLAVIAAAQYALVYNTFRTSRSGPYVDVVARARATVRGVA